MPHTKKPVFACACTSYGFKSLFGEIFKPDNFEKVYILKGSCGSGKSHVIHKISDECKRRGVDFELFGCSFDPNSYDGIIIENPNVAIVDGTSPHFLDPIYPGAVEIVMNTSEGMDEEIILKHRNEIISLYNTESSYFKKSYSFLRAALEIENSLFDIISENFDFGKMISAIKRFSEKEIFQGSGYFKKIRLTSVVCKDGLYESNAFFDLAKKKCLVLDRYGVGHLFLNAILDMASKYDMPVVVSLSPLDFEKINAIYFPEISLAFHLSNNCKKRENYYKVINMERFISKDNLRKVKVKVRFLRRCLEELLSGAISSMREAHNAHEKLENIYSQNTDFRKNDTLCAKLIDSIFI